MGLAELPLQILNLIANLFVVAIRPDSCIFDNFNNLFGKFLFGHAVFAFAITSIIAFLQQPFSYESPPSGLGQTDPLRRHGSMVVY